jgi:predicted NBD/HSP70 family sugar kinase
MASERTSGAKHTRKGIRRVDLAYAELASSEVARDINRDVVLELIRTKQPISRAELTRLSGLQPSTTSSIVEQLLREQWITEVGTVVKGRGRPSTLLSLNTSLVIAVADVRPTQAIVAVVDLNGRFLARETVPIGKDPARGIANIIAVLERMTEKTEARSFEGIGISLPGRVDPQSEALIFAPNLPWAKFDLKRAIEQKLSLQVEMDNAANACLLSELWFGRMDGVRNAVLITISEGIGSAILANGQLVTGNHGMAGEFGHAILERNGLECGCGRRGCWEMYASSRAAIRYFADLEPDVVCNNVMDLLTLAEDGNPNAMQALTRQAEFLGEGLRNIVCALSPEVILLTGGLTSSWERFGPLIEAKVADSQLAGPPPKIVVSADAELARLRGAAALVLQRHSGYTRSSRRSKDARHKTGE